MFVPTAFLGALAMAAGPKASAATESTDAEKANLKIVHDMVATWDVVAGSEPLDIARLSPFFAGEAIARFAFDPRIRLQRAGLTW
jgi:hypothetical protein